MGKDEAVILSEPLMMAFADFVVAMLGWRCPKERWPDLAQAAHTLSTDMKLDRAADGVRLLLAGPLSPRHATILANHLVCGESYFFREPATFDLLRHRALLQLMDRERRTGRRTLRFWSAGCATGEEPYSLAMLLEMAIPDLDAWDVRILATDINADFLQAAERGLYRDWSFRGVPQAVKERFFHRRADERFEIAPRLRERVTFSHLNLAADTVALPSGMSAAVDVILCRNVLMYFERHAAHRVVQHLAGALDAGGWLAVGASEASRFLFQDFATIAEGDAVLYRKTQTPEKPERVRASSESRAAAPAERQRPEPAEDSYRVAFRLFQSKRYAEAADKATERLARMPDEAKTAALLARIHANRGALDEAAEWAQRAIAADRIDGAAHCLHATILIELGRRSEARAALQRAVFLDPDFALAHCMLGALALAEGGTAHARRHLETALSILAAHDPGEMLAEADGMNVGELTEIARSMRDLSTAKVVS